MTRRNLVLLSTRACVGLLSIQGMAGQDLGVGYADDRWAQLEEPWNKFATKLNEGVFDAKAWKTVKKALRNCGVCDK